MKNFVFLVSLGAMLLAGQAFGAVQGHGVTDNGVTGNGQPACAVPSPVEDAMIGLVGVYEGDAMSPVALADRNLETTVVELIVEPGDRPLHLILTSYDNLIWRFTGATDRVSGAVLIASPHYVPNPTVSHSGGRHNIGRSPPRVRYAGVVGLSADRVSTVGPEGCLDYFADPASATAMRLADLISARIGRRPDVIAGAYSPSTLSLPSTATTTASASPPVPLGFDPDLWRAALRFNRSGLADIRPEEVVSSVPVLAYDVLPSQMGLAQLAGDGRIIKVGDRLKIARPIPRFPAGLNGAHAVIFLLGSEVPMPTGSPGHSCVLREADGAAHAPSPLCPPPH